MCSSSCEPETVLLQVNTLASVDGTAGASGIASHVNQSCASSSSLQWHLTRKVAEKLTSVSKVALPIIMTGLIMYSKSIISMLFLGYLGDTQLAAGSLSIGFANITGYSVLQGLASGMDPICCQAYGARKWGIFTQTYRKTLCLLLLTAIPVSLLWLNMEPILLWFGQDQSITSLAKVYIAYSIPDLVAQANFYPLRSFLRTQNINRPLTVSATCSMLLHFPISYILVIYFDLGVKGVALASALYTLNINMGLLLHLFLSAEETVLKPWDKIGTSSTEYSDSWWPLLALAGPSVLSVCLEWWWYELMILLCGLLSNPKANVAAMGIMIQITSFLYVFPSSLSSSLSTLVGHELGADQPAQAHQTSIIGLTLAGVWGFVAFIFSIAVRDLWGKLYTSDPYILGLTSIALPIIGLCEIGNTPQTAAYGILMGSARPKMGCYINFGSFYIIGLPVAVLFGFRLKMGLVGLLYGLVAAQASCLCMMVCTMVRTDWQEQARRSKELTQATELSRNSHLEANFLC